MNNGGAMVILLPYKWTDVGTWGSVYEFFEDGKANYEDGEVIALGTTGSLIKTDNKNETDSRGRPRRYDRGRYRGRTAGHTQT